MEFDKTKSHLAVLLSACSSLVFTNLVIFDKNIVNRSTDTAVFQVVSACFLLSFAFLVRIFKFKVNNTLVFNPAKAGLFLVRSCLGSLSTFLYLYALKTMHVYSFIIVSNVWPLFSVISAAKLLKEKINIINRFYLFIALLCSLMLLLPSLTAFHNLDSAHQTGFLAACLYIFVFSGCQIFNRILRKDFKTEVLIAGESVISIVIAVPAALLFEGDISYFEFKLLPFLFIASVLLGLRQYTLIYACKCSELVFVFPVQYLTTLIGIFYGLMFHDKQRIIEIVAGFGLSVLNGYVFLKKLDFLEFNLE